MEKPLAELIADSAVDVVLHTADGATEYDLSGTIVTGVEFDSRRVVTGSLFCCLRGGTVDGHDFAAAAVQQGAVALVVDHPLDLAPHLAVPQLVAADSRVAMGLFAAAFHGHPARSLRIVGVTGTNGKTTTTSLLASILDEAGMRCGVIGTLTGKHTTPEAPDLQALLAGFRDDGCAAVAMEVSSHALALHRVAGCHFAAGVFTNLGSDHLDLHHTLDDYFAAKAMLFDAGLSDRAVVNIDDPHGRQLVEQVSIPVVAFGADDISDLVVTATSHEYTWRGARVRVGIGGGFNAMNSLAAATTAAALGVEPHVIARGLAAAPAVPGRFEPIVAGQDFAVVVDYAHTPDGLSAVLAAARDAAPGRVVVVFGCGGDRDVEKRPRMGAVAAQLADSVVITSDNPRSEQPLDIINAVFAGVPDDYRARVVTEIDRRLAIATALRSAAPGDVIVIAGKGHEATQTIGDEVRPFDDRAVARELLEERP